MCASDFNTIWARISVPRDSYRPPWACEHLAFNPDLVFWPLLYPLRARVCPPFSSRLQPRNVSTRNHLIAFLQQWRPPLSWCIWAQQLHKYRSFRTVSFLCFISSPPFPPFIHPSSHVFLCMFLLGRGPGGIPAHHHPLLIYLMLTRNFYHLFLEEITWITFCVCLFMSHVNRRFSLISPFICMHAAYCNFTGIILY